MLTLEKETTLHGVPATRRLDSWGWRTDDVSARVAGDRLMTTRLAVGRFRTTARHLTLVPQDEDAVTVVFMISGEVHVDPLGTLFAPGQALIADAGVVCRLRADAPYSLMHATIPNGFRDTVTAGAPVLVRAPDDLRQLTMSFMTALLNASRQLEIGRAAFVIEAAHNLLENVHQLAASQQRFGRRSIVRDIDSAQIVLAEHVDDPTLNVERMAELLRVSRAQLFRIFEAAGTTPMRRLAEVRARKAALLLEEGVLADRDVAERTGFSSPRAMRTALSRARAA
ncbi:MULTISPECIES: helix-turn-helix domain-containing protein [unclassified Microbacterium]|uniref:helix-turn-helix transcriptional regulator n=1 Tax=unclassified Microbacterium TaxID=2609290 RepID=UPI0012F89A46|nr:helix-turn-helix domain-containing protein [Microbacterium sp. MAH-37]MVQ42795.1 helix-turn-helix domain-containing protein [Microbacterium sp. MAH-37]